MSDHWSYITNNVLPPPGKTRPVPLLRELININIQLLTNDEIELLEKLDQEAENKAEGGVAGLQANEPFMLYNKEGQSIIVSNPREIFNALNSGFVFERPQGVTYLSGDHPLMDKTLSLGVGSE